MLVEGDIVLYRSIVIISLIANTLCVGLLIGKQSVEAQSSASGAVPLTISTIAHVYHGAAVDENFKVIPLDPAAIEKIQNSVLDIIAAPRSTSNLDGTLGAKVPPLLGSEAQKKVLESFGDKRAYGMLARQALIYQNIAQLPADERTIYQERVSVVERALSQLPEVRRAMSDPDLSSKMKANNLDRPLGDRSRRARETYIQDCMTNNVPIPPDWPDARWVGHGRLNTTFVNVPNGVSTEVFTYESPGDQGRCYALPRKNAEGGYEALGVICQSKETGKACFWDNIDALGIPITGQDITFKIADVQNGYSLGENCTNCHRGRNVFMIHPETPLADIRDRNPRALQPHRTSELGKSAATLCARGWSLFRLP